MEYYFTKDELYHWAKGAARQNHKYISRYYKNGRWNYIYDDIKQGVKNTTRNAIIKALDWIGADERDAYKKAEWDYGVDRAINKHRLVDRGDGYYGKNKTSVYERDIQKSRAKRNAYEKAKAAYYKTPLGKFEKTARAVDETADKVGKALSRGSNWIKSKSKSVKKKISELSGGKEKLKKANEATVKYSSYINNNRKYLRNDGAKQRSGNGARGMLDPDGFDRQKLNAKRNAYIRSTDAYNKSLRGRMNNILTKNKKNKK